MSKMEFAGEEMVDIVDENGKFVRKATRKEAKENGLLHKAARVIVMSKDGRFVLQKRSGKKDLYPGYWDLGVAETLMSGDSYESAAIRGLEEELGIIGVSNIELMHSLLFKLRHSLSKNNLIYKVYRYVYNGKVSFNPEEIEEVKLLTAAEVEKLIAEGNFTPSGQLCFRKFVEEVMQK